MNSANKTSSVYLSRPISFFVEDIFRNAVQKLPWEYSIKLWRDFGVKHLNIKHGLGRHPVAFVQVDGKNFVVWDAVVDLFVELHTNGIYWGDASLANTLVEFLKVDIPHLGRKTKLKWFLSEHRKMEVPFAEAAQDWLHHVFVPVCELFKQEGVLDFFPGKTVAELYVEIMTNKYYLSKARKKDVGLAHAMRDYAKRFGQGPPLAAFWRGLNQKMRKILGVQARSLMGIT